MYRGHTLTVVGEMSADLAVDASASVTSIVLGGSVHVTARGPRALR